MGTAVIAQPEIRIRAVPLAMLSDERLAALASDGDDNAFATLFERYRAPLSRYCRSIVRDGDEAADAFQNTMLSALRGMRREAPSGRVRPWLYRIAHNESISLLRRHRPDEQLVAETPDRPVDEPETSVAERLASLLGDLRLLPERQRGALVMRELAGLEYDEIGRVFATSAVGARKAVYEARVSLTALAEGRSADCDEIMRQLSDGDGRARRARRVRGHLASCDRCAAFELGVTRRRESLALVPALPGIPLTALLAGSLSGGGAGKALVGGGAAIGGGASAAGGAASFGGGAVAAVKCISLCGALVAAGAGVVVAEHTARHSAPPAAVALAAPPRLLAAPGLAGPTRGTVASAVSHARTTGLGSGSARAGVGVGATTAPATGTGAATGGAASHFHVHAGAGAAALHAVSHAAPVAARSRRISASAAAPVTATTGVTTPAASTPSPVSTTQPTASKPGLPGFLFGGSGASPATSSTSRATVAATAAATLAKALSSAISAAESAAASAAAAATGAAGGASAGGTTTPGTHTLPGVAELLGLFGHSTAGSGASSAPGNQ